MLRRRKTDPGPGAISGVVPASPREKWKLLKTYGLGTNTYVVKLIDYYDLVETIGQVGRFWDVLNQLLLGDRGWRR